MTGFNMLAKSKVLDPDAPAPFMVCASSMNKMQFFLVSSAVITALNFSSNSPRYFDPASNDPISRPHTSCPLINSGTLLLQISCARPSTIAVLPTPGSPTISMLALNLRANTVIMSDSSVLRPIIGSSFAAAANAVILVQYSSSISVACWSDILTSDD